MPIRKIPGAADVIAQNGLGLAAAAVMAALMPQTGTDDQYIQHRRIGFNGFRLGLCECIVPHARPKSWLGRMVMYRRSCGMTKPVLPLAYLYWVFSTNLRHFFQFTAVARRFAATGPGDSGDVDANGRTILPR